MAAPVNPAMAGVGYRQPSLPQIPSYGNMSGPSSIGGAAGINVANPLGAYNQQWNAAVLSQLGQYGNLAKFQPQILSNMVRGEKGVEKGYGNLMSGVGNTLGMGAALGKNGNWGVAQPGAFAINAENAQRQGAITQNAINQGFGSNSGLAQEAQNQNAYYTNQAYGNLASNLANTYAGYQSGIGQNALNYAGNAVNANAQMSQGQLGNLAQQGTLPYPNLGGFAGLYGTQLGYNQSMLGRFMGQPGSYGGGGGASMGGGYPPGGANALQITGAAHGPLPSNVTPGGGSQIPDPFGTGTIAPPSPASAGGYGPNVYNGDQFTPGGSDPYAAAAGLMNAGGYSGDFSGVMG